MTFDRLQTLCGSWRPLAEQDSVLVSLMWQAIERHRKLPAAIHGLSAEELIGGSNSSLLIRIDAIEKQIASLAGKFGMTPADRVRMGDDSPADLQTVRRNGGLLEWGSTAGRPRITTFWIFVMMAWSLYEKKSSRPADDAAKRQTSLHSRSSHD